MVVFVIRECDIHVVLLGNGSWEFELMYWYIVEIGILVVGFVIKC